MKQTEPTTVGFTHVVNWLTASHTESLRSFNNFPFNPRLSAVQTSAQARPSSTQSSSLVIESCMLPISLHPTNTNNVERFTLIIVRITLKEPKTGLAGVILQNSFARFDASMAAFSEERTISRRFCRWALACMGPKSA
jgi:hypothetical protein